jgi:RNA polymerase sigma-70 factor, ECF subfamily
LERTDAQLIGAARNGDVAAFRVLYERHWRMAVGIAFSAVRDRHLAEDAAQEAFAMACRKLANLREGDRFGPWLGTICRRTAKRLRRRQRAHEPMDDNQPAVESEGSAFSRTAVTQAIDRLSPSAREVILLHYFSELSYEEIAQALGISTPSVHGLLQRARRKLAEFLRTEKA